MVEQPIFKEGDVIIPDRQAIEKLIEEGNMKSPTFNRRYMEKYLGVPCIVKYVFNTGEDDCPYWYVTNDDGNDWKWRPEWLLPAFENEEQAFASYVEEKVNENSYKNYLKSVKNS